VELREAVRVAGQGATVVGGAPPGLARFHLQVHDRVPGQRLADPLRSERPAAERDHQSVRTAEQLQHHLFLARAEGVLTFTVEERLDRLTEALLEHAVRVERLATKLRRERPGSRRLARAHEAHQHKSAARYGSRLQPMRSS
jgi:hypothetical protein